MGMGYGAGYADTVEDKFVKKMCPIEFKELDKLLNKHEIDWEEFAREAMYGEYEIDEIEKAFVKLQKKFEKNTRLELGIGFHDQHDEGDRYDEVNGVYWCVGGVYELTTAGKKYESKIFRKLFVTFG